MKNLILIMLTSFCLTGCSFLPRLTTDSPNSVPQAVDKSKAKESCKGKAVWNENGDMISCSKGYVDYTESYNKKERSYTLGEKIGNFFRKLSVLMIILLAIGIIFPVLGIGTFIGRIFEGSFGIAKQALDGVARGVQRVRTRGEDINIALDSELDEKHKRYIRQLKDKENIK